MPNIANACFPSKFFVRQFGWPVWFAPCNVAHFEQEEAEKTEPEILSSLCSLLFKSFWLRPKAAQRLLNVGTRSCQLANGHLLRIQAVHRQDLADGFGRIEQPHARGRKYPNLPAGVHNTTSVRGERPRIEASSARSERTLPTPRPRSGAPSAPTLAGARTARWKTSRDRRSRWTPTTR